jgi:hypothetical protein
MRYKDMYILCILLEYLFIHHIWGTIILWLCRGKNPDTTVRSFSWKCTIKLAMGKNRSSKIHAKISDRLSLSFVDWDGKCKSDWELEVWKHKGKVVGVPGVILMRGMKAISPLCSPPRISASRTRSDMHWTTNHMPLQRPVVGVKFWRRIIGQPIFNESSPGAKPDASKEWRWVWHHWLWDHPHLVQTLLCWH